MTLSETVRKDFKSLGDILTREGGRDGRQIDHRTRCMVSVHSHYFISEIHTTNHERGREGKKIQWFLDALGTSGEMPNRTTLIFCQDMKVGLLLTSRLE